MSKKIRMLVLAGGRSEEHEVSIISTRSLIEALHGSHIEPTPQVITREGRWLSLEESRAALAAGSAKQGGASALTQARAIEGFDVVFPLLHGPYGEDGTVQGFCEVAGLPYVGAGVLASSLCMDKAMTKDVLGRHGLPQVRWVLTTGAEVQRDASGVLARCRELSPPWFVKPANLGSSVGISRVDGPDGLKKAIDFALGYDRRVIIEEGAKNAREVEVALIGNEAPRASVVGEITYGATFYDYQTKYTDGRAGLHIPAQIPEEVAARVRELGARAYALVDGAGFARADFFYLPSGEVLLNEINTIPGFTPYSMFTKLWQATGLTYAEIVDELVRLALERFALRQRLAART